jgi:hypothetical protein
MDERSTWEKTWRATKFGGAWRFQSKASGETEWIYYDSPPLQDLLHLKEIIARKN